MLKRAEVLVIGRSRDALSEVLAQLEEQRPLSVGTRVFANGHGELWSHHEPMPHALVLCVGEDWPETLPGLLTALPANRPPFLVACPASGIELLKTAMRAGARDVVSPPYDADDLVKRLVELSQESQAGKARASARLVAFLNAKGGSGSSFLAANVAAALAGTGGGRVMLVDFDVQFASLSSYLNLSPGNGLIKALESAESLDSTSIGGYGQKHRSGVHLLAAAMVGLISPEDIAEQRVELLLNVLDEAYDNVIVDLPRRMDRVSMTVLERVDQVVVVAQQSVLHLQDAKRTVAILRDYLGITNDRILIVINRYDRKAEVRREDFAVAFPGSDIVTVPSDYRRVAESINLGVPVTEGAAGSPLARSVTQLGKTVVPPAEGSVRRPDGILGWLGLQARN